MPYKNRDDYLRRNREYYQENRDAIKKKALRKYRENRKGILKRRKELRTPERKALAAQIERERYVTYRQIVMDAYGNICACCGQDEPLFLEMDHINGGGRKHRDEIGSSAKALICWLMRNNFPEGFQILCSNCNQGKKRNKGICPHKSKKNQ